MAVVLIVPRDTVIADLVGEFVAAAGHEVVYATNDETATQCVRRSGATVALVDVEHMEPEEVMVARQLRSAGVPVIAFSGRLVEEELNRIAGPWAMATFALPNTVRVLQRAIEAAVEGTLGRESDVDRSSVHDRESLGAARAGRSVAGDIQPREVTRG